VKFTEVVSLVTSYKIDVGMCIQSQNGAAAGCNIGTFGAGWDIKPGLAAPGNGKYAASVSVVNGTITGVAVVRKGLAGQAYILTLVARTTAGLVFDVAAASTCLTAPAICTSN
jgi:hypothetical protein